MAIPAGSASPWPARVAYCAGAAFLAASAATNANYAFARGSNLPSSIIWAGLAVAVAVVAAISWPALMRAVEQRRAAGAAAAIVALVLSSLYGAISALGAASTSRLEAANAETAVSGARKRAQAAYDAARDALAQIPASRTVGEMEALQVAAQRAPQRFGCAAVNGSMRLSCPTIDAELSRARQREKLTAAMEKASGDLAALPAEMAANTDAKTLARYLSAVGIHVTVDRVMDVIMVLTVLIIETGAGLSFALAMVLAPIGTQPSDEALVTGRSAAQKNEQLSGSTAAILQNSPLLAWLDGHGGTATTSIRKVANSLGRSPSSMHNELKRLVRDGVIAMKSGHKGTEITKVPQ